MGQVITMNFLKYLGLLFSRAAQKSVLLTDRLTILIVPFATLALWIAGAEMTESIQETLFLGVAVTVMAVVILRLVAASYWVWREDREKIAEMQTELDLPHTREAAALWKHRLRLRKELGECLGWLITFAEYSVSNSDNPDGLERLYGHKPHKYLAQHTRAREIISQLSYDVALRVMSLNLLGLVQQIVDSRNNQQKSEALIERMWAQRKLTFKFLHRQDIHELITLAEVENLISEFGEGFGDTSLGDLRKVILENPAAFQAKAVSMRALLSRTDIQSPPGTGTKTRQ